MTAYLLALDPGKASGVSLLDITDFDDIKIVWTKELEQWETCSGIDNLCQGAARDEYVLEIVCESFHVTSETAKKSPAMWSSEIIGAVRYFCQRDGIRFTLQTPNAAKTFTDNARLRALGLWHKGGAGHANDSLRHAVLYLVEKRGWRPSGLTA